MTERLVFGNSVQGMLSALGELTPELKVKLVEVGVNPDNLLPAYNVAIYVKLIDFIGAQRFPTLEGHERDRALGQEFIRGFGRTLMARRRWRWAGCSGPCAPPCG